jgi:ferric-dicitrate binding protein FerR (iron transport regulator)
MDMDKESVDIEDLLLRCCEEQATEEEMQFVLNWMEESEENRRIAKQVQMLYLAADTSNVMRKVDIEQALNKVRRRLGFTRIFPIWKWAQRIAVVLILPLITLLAIQYIRMNNAPQQMLVARTNPGMTTSIVLPDSTIVVLNSESTLRYPSSFKGADIRQVTLSGEAFFKVRRDSGRRFIINSGHGTSVEVLGTTFNVESYPQDNNVTATLLEGKIKFGYSSTGMAKNFVMRPGEKVIFNSSKGQITVSRTSGEVESAWKDGKIVFDNTPMVEALRLLGKRFNVTFKIKSARLANDSFTGSFTNQRLEQILEFFKVSSNIRWNYIDSADVSQKHTEIEIY